MRDYLRDQGSDDIKTVIASSAMTGDEELMPMKTPKVSIGLPVFNGADYLIEAVDSILGQTFTDLELLIQDNASTDDTEKISRVYMQKDARVKYVRNSTNVGAAENYNVVFRRAKGRYFKWAAHDDVCAPEFIRQCIEVLENQPSVALCTGETELIHDDGSPVFYNESAGCFVTRDGRQVGRIDAPHRAEGLSPSARYWDVLVHTMRSFEIFGLIRADILRDTVLHENYYGSDKVLLAELSLRGRFQLIPEVLLYRRCHTAQSSRLTATERGVWIGSKAQGAMSTRIRKLIPAYCRIINRSPIGFGQKLLCYTAIGYRFVSPTTWHKEFRLGHYTDSVTS